MGHLVNPLGRQLGDKNFLFWSNNFSFFFNYNMYKRRIFICRFFSKLLKYFFGLLKQKFKLPKFYYNMNYNFLSHGIDLIFIYIEIFGYLRYDYIFSLKSNSNEYLDRYMNVCRIGKKYIYGGISRLKLVIKIILARYIFLFNFWRFRFLKRYLFNHFLRKIGSATKYIRHRFWLLRGESIWRLVRRRYTYKKSGLFKMFLGFNGFYFFIFFKFICLALSIRVLELSQSHRFNELLTYFLCNSVSKLCYVFGIKYVDFRLSNFRDSYWVRIKEFIRYFYWLSDKKNIRIGYLIGYVTKRLKRVKIIRGFRLVVCGRFFRRGRALYRTYSRGVLPIRNRFKFVSFLKVERIKLLGSCSIYLWVYFKKELKFFNDIPVRFYRMKHLKFAKCRRRFKKFFF